METVKEKAREYAIHEYWGVCEIVDCDGMIDKSEEDFKAGVEFAQRWIQIDRCTNGYITAHSLSDIERNLPVIMNDEDGDKDDEYIIIKYISDLLDMDESFTHWRPINLK